MVTLSDEAFILIRAAVIGALEYRGIKPNANPRPEQLLELGIDADARRLLAALRLLEQAIEGARA